MAKEDRRKEDNSDIVKIVGTVCGIFLAVSIMFLIFAKESVIILVPIVWAFVVLGFFAALFEYKSRKNKK